MWFTKSRFRALSHIFFKYLQKRGYSQRGNKVSEVTFLNHWKSKIRFQLPYFFYYNSHMFYLKYATNMR